MQGREQGLWIGQWSSGHSFSSENVGEVESDGDIYGLLFSGGYFRKKRKKNDNYWKYEAKVIHEVLKDLRSWNMFGCR